MNQNLNLTEGNIFTTIAKLALPIMGTSFIQMAYSLTDVMWLGRLSTEAVAAAGAAGFFMWFGAGLTLISQIGVGVGVAQSYGNNQIEDAKSYIANGIQLNLFIAILYSLSLYIFSNGIIGFFNIENIHVFDMAIEYLKIISLGIVFHFMNPIFSTILNSTGNSMTPFKINTLGLIFNMLLDPLLIFGLGPIKAFGIKGAAMATVFSQILVFSTFIIIGKLFETLYSNVNVFKRTEKKFIQRIAKLGFPA